MPLTTITTITCDGDGREIEPESSYITMKDAQGNTIYLHDYSCLTDYASLKAPEQAEKIAESERSVLGEQRLSI